MDSNIEKRVASIENKYRLMADRFIDAVWVVDASTMKYLFISPDIYKLRGYTQEELTGSDVKDNFTPASYKKISGLFKKAHEEWAAGIKKSYNTELEIRHKNGSYMWIEITAKFIEEQDDVLKIVGITRNIDKRKKAEKKQEAAYRELKKP